MGIQNWNCSATNNNTNNMKAFIALSALLAVAATMPAGPPAYHAPAPGYGKGPLYEDTAPVYGYEYAVADDYSKVNFGQNENFAMLELMFISLRCSCIWMWFFYLYQCNFVNHSIT